MSFACIVALLLSAGCANQLRFHLVDNASRNPVVNAEVTVREGSSFSYFYRKPHIRAVGSTDTNGNITVPAVGRKDTVFFHAPGYRGASAGFVGKGKVGFGPMPPLNVDTMYLEQQVVDSAGIITIPLLPEAGKQ